MSKPSIVMVKTVTIWFTDMSKPGIIMMLLVLTCHLSCSDYVLVLMYHLMVHRWCQ